MQELRQKLELLLSNTLSDKSSNEYKKLISFIDASITQAFKLSEEEKASFLITNILSMRDYMQSEVVTGTIAKDARIKVLKVYDEHYKTDAERGQEIKKKESELEERQHLQESLSEIDQRTS